MPNFCSLEDKSAIVTGASRGIGLEIARSYARAGAAVTIIGRDQRTLEAAAAAIEGMVSFVVGPVEDEGVVAEAVDAALRPTGQIDILVNNAGGPPPDAPLVRIAMADFDSAIALNLRAPLVWTRAVWDGSMRKHGGAVLNIASIGGLSTPRGMGAYATAKAGLLHMTRMLAAELGPKVRVNAIAPGVVRTDATSAVDYEAFARILPMQRVGEVGDIASAALFLASDEAGWITGQTLTIEGGTLIEKGRLKRGWDEE